MSTLIDQHESLIAQFQDGDILKQQRFSVSGLVSDQTNQSEIDAVFGAIRQRREEGMRRASELLLFGFPIRMTK